VNFASALTQATKDALQMTRADRVHSTPPTNTPVDPTRRRFLSQAAGVAAGGTALALAAANALASPATRTKRPPEGGLPDL
jgi:ferric-dicitrate binding protein FerR (iron transport regulator)